MHPDNIPGSGDENRTPGTPVPPTAPPPDRAAERQSTWERIRRTILVAGGFIGAVTAIITIPSAGHSVWKNALELRDRFTQPDIEAYADRFAIRCAVRREPDDLGRLELEKHCDPGAFTASVQLAFVNKDFLPRSVRMLHARLELFGPDGTVESQELNWPRVARNQTINGLDSVVWSEWRSIDFGPRESETQEIFFTSTKADAEPYRRFREAMYTKSDSPRWTKARIAVYAGFVGSQTFSLIFECASEFKPENIRQRQLDPRKQNQITLECPPGETSTQASDKSIKSPDELGNPHS